jgi:hypothetical protein
MYSKISIDVKVVSSMQQKVPNLVGYREPLAYCRVRCIYPNNDTSPFLEQQSGKITLQGLQANSGSKGPSDVFDWNRGVDDLRNTQKIFDSPLDG